MLQIRGLVKAAQKAQEQLKLGVRDVDVPTFAHFVLTSVETVERLCADARVTPHQLPARSRQAYYFLKNIDLQNLPSTGTHPRSMVQTIGIKNIKAQQRAISWNILQLAMKPHVDSEQMHEVVSQIHQVVCAIEKICLTQQVTPANLTSSSRQIYAWLKFLAPSENLKLHIEATRRVHKIAKQLCQHYGYDSVNFSVEITNLAGLYRSRWVGNDINLIMSEGFIHAGEDVLTALVHTSLRGKSPSNTRIIREYASQDEFSEVLLELDLIVETVSEDGKGVYYNLETLFDNINNEYFCGKLSRPRLIWSQMQTYRKFGHYEPARDRIVISLTLDEQIIPQYVVEFVIYHEMLHKHYGEKWVNGRRMVHTSEFRASEAKFKYYNEAEAWLSKLASRKNS
jgi:hypothetical protein